MTVAIVVVGLLLSAYVMSIAVKPGWYRNAEVRLRDSDGHYRGSIRVGDMPSGLVRVVYSLLALFLLVATIVACSASVQKDQCTKAFAVYQSADQGKAAAAAGYSLQVTERQKYTEYALVRDGVTVAGWSKGVPYGGDGFECPPGTRFYG